MLRYNLLVMLLCVLMTQPYQSYYFVPLVTFHYVLVNIILMIPPQLTHGTQTVILMIIFNVYCVVNYGMFVFM